MTYSPIGYRGVYSALRYICMHAWTAEVPGHPITHPWHAWTAEVPGHPITHPHQCTDTSEVQVYSLQWQAQHPPLPLFKKPPPLGFGVTAHGLR